MKRWLKHHAVYQRWNRIETRMPTFLEHVKLFKGLNVLEMGCNAGIYGYEIAKVAKSYIGADQGKEYIKQAQETKKFFKMDNAIYVNRPIKGFVRDIQKAEAQNVMPYEINALFATFVLYHLSDKETDLLKQTILPRCKLVIIMTRTAKRSPWKKYNSMKLHKIKNVEKYLTSAGFTCKSTTHYNKKKGKIDFGITIAKRKLVRKKVEE
jgi:2-polyprenyl-3-methyl-5-hydroxy-6-metoxy-1,4-benzoquinol methylase